MTLSRDEPLALNAVGSVVVRGLVKTSAGREVDVQAVRFKPPPLIAVRHGAGALTRPDGVPPRVPDNLPEPRDFRLELSIGEKLSSGRCGKVFLTSAISLLDPSDPSDIISCPVPPVLPELVLKVARPNYIKRLRREAAAYHEIQAIQGVSVARCYGWFEAELDQDHILLDGCESDSDSDSSGAATRRSKANLASPTNKVSFLVLERLGGNLEMYVDYERDLDIYEVYEDLAYMGVSHADVRYANILMPPESPLALPTLKCPYHNVVHYYRIVDFDRAVKTDFSMEGYSERRETDLGILFEGILHGHIIEPWL